MFIALVVGMEEAAASHCGGALAASGERIRAAVAASARPQPSRKREPRTSRSQSDARGRRRCRTEMRTARKGASAQALSRPSHLPTHTVAVMFTPGRGRRQGTSAFRLSRASGTTLDGREDMARTPASAR